MESAYSILMLKEAYVTRIISLLLTVNSWRNNLLLTDNLGFSLIFKDHTHYIKHTLFALFSLYFCDIHWAPTMFTKLRFHRFCHSWGKLLPKVSEPTSNIQPRSCQIKFLLLYDLLNMIIDDRIVKLYHQKLAEQDLLINKH